MVKKRNAVLCLILSIVTCGIYGLVWFCNLTKDMNELTPDDSYQTSGMLALVLTIVTCGLYGIYWMYKMGCKMDSLKSGNHAVLFIILSLFGLGIVNYFIMQNEINNHAGIR